MPMSNSRSSQTTDVCPPSFYVLLQIQPFVDI
uniref:Uncharacterized protein n=1 Tax=Arundo donax TaxID=35708 RepID=A0A0A9F9J3_ARUDO